MLLVMCVVSCTWTKACEVSSRAAPGPQSPWAGAGPPCRSKHPEQTLEPACQWGDRPECLPIVHRPSDSYYKKHESLLKKTEQWRTKEWVYRENNEDVNMLCTGRRELEAIEKHKDPLWQYWETEFSLNLAIYHAVPLGNKAYLLDTLWLKCTNGSLAYNIEDECCGSEASVCITGGQKERNLERMNNGWKN